MKTIFRVEVEVSQMKGCQLPDDCKGAFVNVYIGSDHIKNAIDRVEASLLNDCYKPIRTYAAYELDLEEDNEVDEEGYPKAGDLQDIRNNSEVWYGPFHTYPYRESNQEE